MRIPTEKTVLGHLSSLISLYEEDGGYKREEKNKRDSE